MSFLVCRRNLIFTSDSSDPEISGVGIPQGSVVSPLLFSLVLRRLKNSLPAGVGISMYADDDLLYVTSDKMQDALALLLRAVQISCNG